MVCVGTGLANAASARTTTSLPGTSSIRCTPG